jgi:putative DNA primase/helicase
MRAPAEDHLNGRIHKLFGPQGQRATGGGHRHEDADHQATREAESSDSPSARLILRRASEIEPEEVEWLWPNVIPRGMVSLFAGHGGIGKSTVALSIAAACSRQAPLPDGTRAPLLNTLICAAEDSAAHTTVPRLLALGADMDRIQIVQGVVTDGGDPAWLQLRQHIQAIESAVVEHHLGLAIIDPVSSYIGDANSDRESDVRAALMPIVNMAERTGCSVLLIRHVSKTGDGYRAASRILGSTAWHDVPRSVLMLAEAPEDHQPDQREDGTRDRVLTLGVVKNNLAHKPAALRCVQTRDGLLRWEGVSAVSIDECFAYRPESGSVQKDAESWLREQLTGGSKPTSAIDDAARDAGISRASLKRARASLKVIPFQMPGKKAGGWMMRLPNGSASVAHVRRTPTTDPEIPGDSSLSVAHHEPLIKRPEHQGFVQVPSLDDAESPGLQSASVDHWTTYDAHEPVTSDSSPYLSSDIDLDVDDDADLDPDRGGDELIDMSQGSIEL